MFFVFDFEKLRFVASLKYQMPLKHYLSPQSGRRLAERSEAIIFLEHVTLTSYPETSLVTMSYQICSTVTSQIIPRHLIAGPAECAQR